MRKEAFSLATLEVASDEYVKPVGTIEMTETLETIALTIRTLKSDQIALVTITLNFALDGRMGNNYPDLANHSARYYLEHVRSLVRRTDSVFLHNQTYYFILPGANLQGGAIVQERLWDALLWHINNTHEGDYLHPYRISTGHSTCSHPFIDIFQCINAACEPKRSFVLQPGKAARRTSEMSGLNELNEMELPELARRLGVPYVSFLPRKLPVRLQRLVTPMLAQELCCFPIGRDRDILTVAMSNPQDCRVLDRLRKETGLTIFPVLAHPHELQTVLEQFS
jgi:Type II secretion system (T2SS), protein E, N-terminal domain